MFDELSLNFLPHVMHCPRLISLPFLKRSNSDIFSFCYTSTLQTIHFNIGKNKKIYKYKNGSKNLAWNENLSKRCYHSLLPQGIRGLIIGKSGYGKTTLLINLLLRPGWLDYNSINIFGKSLFQPEYHILKKAFEEQLPKEVITRLFENQNEITDLGIIP